jgi:hypothetical protein
VQPTSTPQHGLRGLVRAPSQRFQQRLRELRRALLGGLGSRQPRLFVPQVVEHAPRRARLQGRRPAGQPAIRRARPAKGILKQGHERLAGRLAIAGVQFHPRRVEAETGAATIGRLRIVDQQLQEAHDIAQAPVVACGSRRIRHGRRRPRLGGRARSPQHEVEHVD